MPHPGVAGSGGFRQLKHDCILNSWENLLAVPMLIKDPDVMSCGDVLRDANLDLFRLNIAKMGGLGEAQFSKGLKVIDGSTIASAHFEAKQVCCFWAQRSNIQLPEAILD